MQFVVQLFKVFLNNCIFLMYFNKFMKELQGIDSQTTLVKAIKSNDSKALKSLYASNYYKVEHMVLKIKPTTLKIAGVFRKMCCCMAACAGSRLTT